jgi:hypothetical protein
VSGKARQGDLEEDVRRLAAGGKISCRAAFGIAERRGLSVADVGRAIDGMGIKIVACQLGCFK